jgi:hypothetical protein
MQSPRAEYLLFGAGFAAFDYMRARGEADGDTLSEVTRDLVARHRLGPAIFLIGLAAASIGFAVHILGPLEKP